MFKQKKETRCLPVLQREKGKEKEERGVPLPFFVRFFFCPTLLCFSERKRERRCKIFSLHLSLSLFAPSKRERGEELVCRRRYHHCFSLREREREKSAAPKVSVFLQGFALNNKEEALQTNKAKD